MIRINFEHFSFQGETAISLSNWMMKVEVQEQTPEFCQNAYKGMLFQPSKIYVTFNYVTVTIFQIGWIQT